MSSFWGFCCPVPPSGSTLSQRHLQNLRNRYYRYRLPLDLAAGLFSGGLFAAGSTIINLLYDARYNDAGPILQTLSIGLAFYPLQFIRSAFTAIGDTRLVASVSIIEAISLITFMASGFVAFGINGAIIGIAGHRLVPSLTFWFLSYRKNWFNLLSELRIVAIFLLGLFAGKLFLLLSSWLDLPVLRHLLSKPHETR
jgi:O-antigen/teichoic acid export membrane protein